MNSLQLSPISGVSTAAIPSHQAGEASSASSTTPESAPSPAHVFNPNGQTTEQQIAASRRDEAAKAAQAQADKPKEPAPSFNLKVGLVSGTYDVFVDIVDPKLNRTVYRIFGPPSETVASEAEKKNEPSAASAYTRTTGSSDKPTSASVKTEV